MVSEVNIMFSQRSVFCYDYEYSYRRTYYILIICIVYNDLNYYSFKTFCIK